MKKEIIVYTLDVCPNCRDLKETLTANGIKYKEKDMGTPAARTNLLMHSVFTSTAPVLQIGDKIMTYDQLFDFTGEVNLQAILGVL